LLKGQQQISFGIECLHLTKGEKKGSRAGPGPGRQNGPARVPRAFRGARSWSLKSLGAAKARIWTRPAQRSSLLLTRSPLPRERRFPPRSGDRFERSCRLFPGSSDLQGGAMTASRGATIFSAGAVISRTGAAILRRGRETHERER
jgi:hypothetical protein